MTCVICHSEERSGEESWEHDEGVPKTLRSYAP